MEHSTPLERTNTPETLSSTVSEQLFSRESAKRYLTEVYTGIRDQENRLEDSLRTFVMNNDTWNPYREGAHLGLDTVVSGPNGEAFRIWLTSEHSEAFSQRPNGTLQQFSGAIVSEATEFRIEYFSAEAVKYLSKIAPRKESLLNKTRQIHTATKVRERWSTHISNPKDRMDEFFQSGDFSVHLVPFTAPDPVLLGANDARQILEEAMVNRARMISERETHHQEYRHLLNELQNNPELTDDSKDEITRRLLWIQAVNGYKSSHIEWRSVLPRGLDREGALSFDTTWDIDMIQNLEAILANNLPLTLLRHTLRTHTIAAQAVRSLTSPKTETLHL